MEKINEVNEKNTIPWKCVHCPIRIKLITFDKTILYCKDMSN